MLDILPELTERLKNHFGSDLRALVLYGSAVRGGFRKGISDINILVVLEKSSPRKIFEMGSALKSILRKHRINPLVMTHEELVSSVDVFPLEYGEIQGAFKVLYGDESVLDLKLCPDMLRYQLEEKLRGAVNDMRNMLILAEGKDKLLGKLLLSWSGLCGTLFRGLLRLKDINDIPAEALLERITAEYGVCMDSFAVLGRFRQGEKTCALDLAETLLEALKAMVRVVNEMQNKQGGDS